MKGPIDLWRSLVREIAADKGSSDHDLELKVVLTINSPLYAALVARATNEEVGRLCHSAILAEAMSVLALDKFYETGEASYEELSSQYRNRASSLITKVTNESLRALENELSSFWRTEARMKHTLGKNEEIPVSEIEKFTLQKSTDVHAYWHIAASFAPLEETCHSLLYLQQLERDLEDDFADLEEDHSIGMPNPILLRLIGRENYSSSRKFTQEQLSSLARKSGALATHRAFVHTYVATLHPKIPDEYRWALACANPTI